MLGFHSISETSISSLVETGTLMIVDLQHSHSLDGNLNLTQKHFLSVADLIHSQVLDNVVLTEHKTLEIQDTLHSHTLESATLSQKHFLLINDAVHSQSLDNLVLTQKHLLTIADALHSQNLETTEPIEHKTVSIDDLFHSHALDGVLDILQDYHLLVDDLSHTQTLDAIVVEFHQFHQVDSATGEIIIETPKIEIKPVRIAIDLHEVRSAMNTGEEKPRVSINKNPPSLL